VAKGEVVINEVLCKGCELCIVFCPQSCIILSEGKINAEGYILPVIDEPENCNACGICGQMCPDLAINVYRYKESKTA
jgi:2-oxoglutarate ferredoxin oxidoreductase subunit delta